MKKILSVLLSLAILAGISTSVFATETEQSDQKQPDSSTVETITSTPIEKCPKPDPVCPALPTSGSTKVSADVCTEYQVDIPEEINFPTLRKDQGNQALSYTLYVKNVCIQKGEYIKITSADTITMKAPGANDEVAEITALNNLATDLISYDSPFPGIVYINTNEIEFAGEYSGTINFNISLTH